MAIYPETFEVKLGFDRIRAFLHEGCLCGLGRERVEQIKFQDKYEDIASQLILTAELKQILLFEENFPQDNFTDARNNVSKMAIDGSTPEIQDLIIIRNALQAIEAVCRFFKSADKKEKYPEIARLANNTQVFPNVIAEVDRIIDKNNQVKDSASNELRDIRSQIKQKQNEVNRKLQSVLKKAKSDGLVDDDVEITFRNSRPVIPVPSGNKRMLGGMMHDESSTGKTAFIEPGVVVELNNKVRELQISEGREIKKILRAFADFFRPSISEIEQSFFFLGEVDFLRSKARFAIRIEAVKPVLQNKQEFNWRNAVHPLLYLAHKKENKDVIPLSLFLNNAERILVISGPNAGGKSVCLKTVGLLQYMLQCGLLVPMGENSECGIFETIFIDIGDEQSIDNDLSTYSGHLENMKYFVKRADKKTLFLIDEFGTGTEPALGGAIAEAVLEKLHTLKAYGIITTHYANLKHFASETEGIMNGAMLFDTQSIKPLYQLSMGKPGSSFAIDIARKIGLPEDILNKATENVGQEHFNYDKQLREIARDKSYWETKRQKIRKVERTLDNLYDKYSDELNDIQKERKVILREAQTEAKRLLSEVNAKVENAIREIREAQADKERTKKIREEIEGFKKNFEKQTELNDRYSTKKQELEKAGKKLAEHSPDMSQSKINKQKVKPKIELQPGDIVNLKGFDTKGEIIKMEGKHVTIAFGNMLSTLEIEKIELSQQQDKQKPKHAVRIDENITNRKLNFKPEIDVRGKRADDALYTVQQFFDEAIMANARHVTILHGKGNGILRQLIRDYALSLNYISKCTDAHADRGGAGITEVYFDY
ncbi:MAG: Smr/MutS family protein [Bacteroidales bacterium]|nr:Smr/MutS family protein [Bacteroidales bacterium]MBN2821530.1 Smr/MutS family protein [Bacteroidales bacterium]